MRNIRTITALAAATVSLGAAPAALANTSTVGNANGSPTMNVCVASIDCTYLNFHKGKASDVIKHSGTLTSWTLNAASTTGKVQLRIVHPTGAGHFKVVFTSKTKTVNRFGKNTFSAHIKVKAGDVLALSNNNSGLYMASASPEDSVRYFMGSLDTGWSFTPNQNVSQLHLLLSARVKS